MEQVPSVPFEDLLKLVSFGATSPDILSSLAGRLARMEHRLSAEDASKIRHASGGHSLKELSRRLVEALNPDRHLEQARMDLGMLPDSDQPVPEQAIKAAAESLIRQAVSPLHDPALRDLLAEVKKKELVIDTVSPDTLIFAGFTEDKAKGVIESFQQFIEDHKDEITALQILYSQPYRARLDLGAVRELADRLVAELPPLRVYATHPNNWEQRVPEELWQAYRKLDARVSGHVGARFLLTDLVSLVRFAIHQDNELVPFPERVNANFKAWLHSLPSPASGGGAGGEGRFTPEQMKWLEMIRDHIAANLGIEPDDFEYAPFAQEGGLGKVYQLFGDELNSLIEQLNESLAA
jgi:type I restriction enzyme R subunit